MEPKKKVLIVKLFKNKYIGISSKIKILADSGYQGITKIHANSETPKKGSKLHPLTKEDKENNKMISKKRIFIEHINSHIKRFKIMSIGIEIKERNMGLECLLYVVYITTS